MSDTLELVISFFISAASVGFMSWLIHGRYEHHKIAHAYLIKEMEKIIQEAENDSKLERARLIAELAIYNVNRGIYE